MNEINSGKSTRKSKGHQELLLKANHQLSELSACIYKGNRRQKLKKNSIH